MSIRKAMLGGLWLSFLLLSLQPAARAQSVADVTFEAMPIAEGDAEALDSLESVGLIPVETEASETAASETAVSETEVAQVRRRTRNAPGQRTNDFIGIGADFGFADDVSFAIISKLSINDTVAVRPSIFIGDDFAVLVPITYEFSRFSADVGDFQLRPYAGIGAAFVDDDDDEEFNLLLSGGVDIPVARRFTVNAQANLGVIDDTNFGVSLGVGYNFGRIFR